METAPAAVSFHLLSDDELLSLLRTEEDRLPRAIVDEFVRRGERLVAPLVELCRDEAAWAAEAPAAWAPLHAVLILGAVGSPRALPGLLAAVRQSAARGLAGTASALANVLGALGRAATGPLKVRALDPQAPASERTLAVDALAAVAARTPIEQGEILDFFRALTEDMDAADEVRNAAARALLRFVRPGDRTLVLSAALRQEWGEGTPLFTRADVERAYRSGSPDLSRYFRDGLEFYAPEEIRRRTLRARERAEDARWARGVSRGARWVEEARCQLLRRYEWTLLDLDDEPRGDALWVAESMTEYLVWHEGRAPWRWNGSTAFAYLMDAFARRVTMDAAGRIGAVPRNLVRFVRFCESEGFLASEDRAAAEAVVDAERDELVGAALDPQRRRGARATLERLLAQGVDPADREATDRWLRSSA
jgi:hypothetical protein